MYLNAEDLSQGGLIPQQRSSLVDEALFRGRWVFWERIPNLFFESRNGQT